MYLGKSSFFYLKIANVTDLSSRSCSSLRELFFALCFLIFHWVKSDFWRSHCSKNELILSFCVLENTIFRHCCAFSYLDTLNEEKQMLVHIIFFVLEHNLKCLLLLKGESEGTSYRF